MIHLGRRRFVAVAVTMPAALFAPRAHATLMRGLSLRALCAQSRHIALLKATEARCVSLPIAGRQMLVTETRVRIEESLSKVTAQHSEVVVRTLGGVLDGVGELVHGQAEFTLDARCLAFLTCAPDGSLWVAGMAQGHYPLIASGSELQLRASPNLPTLRDFERSAVHGLVGTTLHRARGLIAREGGQ